MSELPLPPADRDDLQVALVRTYLKQLHLPAMARECVALARDAQTRGNGPLAYLQALLEQEVTQRADRQRQRRLAQARFPFQKRLEEFDFSAVPALSQARILELAQGNFVAQHQNLLLVGPSGVGKTHLLIGAGRAVCLAGYRVLFRTAHALATELELAQKELRLPKLLAQYRKVDLILVDELGYLPFAQSSAEVLFQFFSDRYEVASVGITSNLEFARWTEVFGNERLTAALLDRLVHRSHAFLLEGASYRFRQSLQQREGPATL
jgi:DNA replication protein DnaC